VAGEGTSYKYEQMIRKNRYGFAAPYDVADPAFFHHDPSLCFESPCGRLRYVPIMKCMHTVLQNWCQSAGWEQVDRMANPSDCAYVCVLRDPVDRWCSSIEMYLSMRGMDLHSLPPEAQKILASSMVVDEHTEPQHRFLVGLKLSQMFAVDMNDDANQRLGELLGSYGYVLDIPTQRPTKRDRPSWLSSAVAECSFRDKLTARYNQDYWLRLWLLDKELPHNILATRRQ
jgi:hypothetical protein